MPFYEYQCQACGHHHEAMQKMSDAPLRRCPECGKAKLKRLISAPVFRLKGGGWYETDFKSDQEKKRNLHGDEAKSEKADKADKAEKADTGDAKTAAPAKPEPQAAATPEAKPAAAAKPPAKAPAGTRRAARKPARRR